MELKKKTEKKKYQKPKILTEKIGEGRLKPAVQCDGVKINQGRKASAPCTVTKT